jgi:hypothetical protein
MQPFPSSIIRADGLSAFDYLALNVLGVEYSCLCSSLLTQFNQVLIIFNRPAAASADAVGHSVPQ